MTAWRRGYELCRDHARYDEKRDAACKLLLAYAECADTADENGQYWDSTVLRKHGFISGFHHEFVNNLRTRALAAAREAE